MRPFACLAAAFFAHKKDGVSHYGAKWLLNPSQVRYIGGREGEGMSRTVTEWARGAATAASADKRLIEL